MFNFNFGILYFINKKLKAVFCKTLAINEYKNPSDPVSGQLEVSRSNSQILSPLHILNSHANIADQQVKSSKSLKDNNVESDVFLQYDFSKNCSFLLHDATQSFHWNNKEATRLTSVYYDRDGQDLSFFRPSYYLASASPRK